MNYCVDCGKETKGKGLRCYSCSNKINKKGKSSWSKGLTKETDERVRKNGEAISKALKGKHHTEGARRKMSKAQKGENNPMFGKHHTEKTKKKMSKGHKGKHYPKLSKACKGENNPNFNNWSSRFPYNVNDWTCDLKKFIRERDDYQCQFCGIKENGRKHSVHHIDYDKQNCSKENLITLCLSHNMKANFGKNKWQFLFETLQEIRSM